MATNLFTPLQMGPYTLANRIVMAPLTRNRAGAGNVPQPMSVEYYRQRASAGLIITEGSQISPAAVGYPATPGIHSPEQIAGWKQVTDAVHGRGGRIFLQLWHCGRISHPSLLDTGTLPVAPSAIKPEGQAFTYRGLQPFVTPRALETAELPGIIEDYRKAAQNALAAGFDGVEIHAANGYLLDQFLRDGTNRRTDRYGGSIANRARLLLEVVDAVIDVFGRERIGVRISPHARGDGIADSDPASIFGYTAGALSERGIAYLHLIEAAKPGLPQSPPEGAEPLMPLLRRAFNGPLIVNGGYDKASANAVIAAGAADLVAFAALFIANPDLVARLRRDAPLNPPDPSSFHQGGAKGYIDYPTLDETAAAARV